MTPEKREERKAYFREYYRKNKAKWQTPEALEKSRIRAKATAAKTPPEVLKAKRRTHYEQNLEKSIAKARKWQAYYLERKDRFRELGAAWRKANPEKTVAYANLRRARLQNIGSTGVSPSEWALILEQFDHLCAYCQKPNGSKRLERDHVIPVSKGGLDHPDNVVPACRTCNARKAARLDWKP
jgi:5-methylcytosine-specific restriction endonuclease McrA